MDTKCQNMVLFILYRQVPSIIVETYIIPFVFILTLFASAFNSYNYCLESSKTNFFAVSLNFIRDGFKAQFELACQVNAPVLVLWALFWIVGLTYPNPRFFQPMK